MIYTIYATSKNVANGLLWVASIDFEMFACSYSEPKVMKAVTTLGRQLDGEMFVLGPTLQVSSNGDPRKPGLRVGAAGD